MKLELIQDWKTVLDRAWSVKFQVLAGMCGVLELVLPLFVQDMPRGWFAAASALNAALGIGARVLAQKEIVSVTLPPEK